MMENTNDKQAAGAASIDTVKLFDLINTRTAQTNSGAVAEANTALIEFLSQWGDACAEEARREAAGTAQALLENVRARDELIQRLKEELDRATLMVREQATQRTAGGNWRAAAGGGGLSPSHGGGMGSAYNPASDQRGGGRSGTGGGASGTWTPEPGQIIAAAGGPDGVRFATAAQPVAEASPSAAGGDAVADCPEQETSAFEAWASGDKYDMTTHPMHWLFLNERTYAARQGWKAALAFVRSVLAAQPVAEAACTHCNGRGVTGVSSTDCEGNAMPDTEIDCDKCDGQHRPAPVAEAAAQAGMVRAFNAMLDAAAAIDGAAPTAQQPEAQADDYVMEMWNEWYGSGDDAKTPQQQAIRHWTQQAFIAGASLRRPGATPTAQPTQAAAQNEANSPQTRMDAQSEPLLAAQPTPPDDELTVLHKFLLGEAPLRGHQFSETPAGCGVYWWRGDLRAAIYRAALRRPGALPTAPRTRRDINVAHLAPAIRALHDAFLAHDSAAMTLFARDDQVAWIAKDGMGNPKPVPVGQLREVLVAALGLPAGTKFGG